MKIYKSSLFRIIKKFVFAIFIGFASLIILSFFIENDAILYGIAALITLYLIYLGLIAENISVIITDDGHLIIRNLNKVIGSYCLTDKKFTSYIELSHDNLISDNYCRLNIIDKNSGDEVAIDCSMLGLSGFLALIKELKMSGCSVKRVKKSKSKK